MSVLDLSAFLLSSRPDNTHDVTQPFLFARNDWGGLPSSRLELTISSITFEFCLPPDIEQLDSNAKFIAQCEKAQLQMQKHICSARSKRRRLETEIADIRLKEYALFLEDLDLVVKSENNKKEYKRLRLEVANRRRQKDKVLRSIDCQYEALRHLS